MLSGSSCGNPGYKRTRTREAVYLPRRFSRLPPFNHPGTPWTYSSQILPSPPLPDLRCMTLKGKVKGRRGSEISLLLTFADLSRQ